MKISANPMVTLGLAVICTFLPITATVVVAVALTVVQFYALSVGVAAVAAVIFFNHVYFDFRLRRIRRLFYY